MARCYQCGKEIGYFAFVVGAFKRFGKNMWRRSLPVFNCPHCGVECQEASITAFPFIILFIGIGVSAVVMLRNLDISIDKVSMMGLLLFLYLSHYLWWQFVSKLKEPHQFFWE